jgi:uncharacterized membrane protein YeaQ/YmgE (transglycosylase-associated protein family)
METTVTGMFPNKRLASQAAVRLLTVGFRADQVHVVDRRTPDRHAFIADRTAATRRAVLLGIVFGAIGGTLAGAAFASTFGLLLAILLGGVAAAVGGALLGLLVGRSTTSQVKEELEHQVDGGTVLVSVTADREQEPILMELLAKEGGSSLVSTAASFTGGVVPTTPT